MQESNETTRFLSGPRGTLEPPMNSLHLCIMQVGGHKVAFMHSLLQAKTVGAGHVTDVKLTLRAIATLERLRTRIQYTAHWATTDSTTAHAQSRLLMLRTEGLSPPERLLITWLPTIWQPGDSPVLGISAAASQIVGVEMGEKMLVKGGLSQALALLSVQKVDQLS